uniref:Uncharacterized protein n=1 Tax=Meloidogyne enterolobii TaxID=390850 RepID=A0A6V7U5D2_MELEN|nr:unnamed protein product [Meloidogyne enterolobii]
METDIFKKYFNIKTWIKFRYKGIGMLKMIVNCNWQKDGNGHWRLHSHFVIR